MNILVLESLCFSYSTKPLLAEISLSLLGGSVVVVSGPSGGGKSTLLYLLGLMLRPSAGTMTLDGVDVCSMSDSERARLRATAYAFVFQDACLDMSRSVLDNVTEGAIYAGRDHRSARARARQLLSQFHVDVDPRRRPGQVSGGQAQRIALCRALLGDPQIILADEPTGNLDPLNAALVLDALRARANLGSLVVIASHDPDIVNRGDHQIRVS